MSLGNVASVHCRTASQSQKAQNTPPSPPTPSPSSRTPCVPSLSPHPPLVTPYPRRTSTLTVTHQPPQTSCLQGCNNKRTALRAP